MDTIEFKINRSYTFPTVEIFINQHNLISIVRDHEMPFAEAEGSPSIAGGYMGLSADWVLPPSRHFFGKPHANYDDFGRKTTLLACRACGEPLCWPLLTHISIGEDTITWQNFTQPHRKDSWNYDSFGPFEFDRTQYEMALAHAGKEIGS